MILQGLYYPMIILGVMRLLEIIIIILIVLIWGNGTSSIGLARSKMIPITTHALGNMAIFTLSLISS